MTSASDRGAAGSGAARRDVSGRDCGQDIRALAALLRCPVCVGPLSLTGTVLRCGKGHRFDAARQGYFNLLTGRGTAFASDTAEMVQARIDFLAAGHYRPMAQALTQNVAALAPDAATVLDAGAGTGYYLQLLLQRLPQARAVAVDISKFALRRSARALPRTISLVWDIWRELPLQDQSMDVILNVFAPRNAASFHRVLRPGGLLAIVTPRPGHLAEIAGTAALLRIAGGKEQQLQQTLAGHFRLQERRELDVPLLLSPADIRRAALMGPAAHHLNRDELDRRLQAPEAAATAVTARFTLSFFRPVSDKSPDQA